MSRLPIKRKMELQKIDSTISISTKLIIEINNRNALEFYEQGLIHYKNNLLKDAEKCFIKAIEIKPDFVNSYIELIALMVELDEWDKALKFSDKSIENTNEIPNLYYVRGSVKFERKEYLEAIQDFTNAIKLQKKLNIDYSELVIESYQLRSEAKKHIGDFEGAKRDLYISNLESKKITEDRFF